MAACPRRLVTVVVLVVTFAGTVALLRGQGTGAYVDGLRQITASQYVEAAATLEQALAADDEQADRHVARAIALLLARRGPEAKAHLDRARRLAPRHAAVPVWLYLYQWAYAWPMRSIPEVPHGSSEPYANDLIEATTRYRNLLDANQPAAAAAAWRDVERVAATWAWRELAKPELLAAQAADLDALYARKEYARCIEVTSRLLESNPADARLLAIRGGSRLALQDHHGARTDYTRALRVNPTAAGLVLGRGLAAARGGALRTAEADRALAARLDPKLAATYRADLEGAIAAARQRVVAEPTTDLLAALETAAEKAPVDALLAAADRLVRADAADRLILAEGYTQELARLQFAFDQDRADVEKAVALAAFCIRPTLTVPLRPPRNPGTARVRAGEPDLDRARGALDVAGQLDRDHHGALTQQALWMEARDARQRMIQTVEYAFSKGALNYDLARMYLDFYQELAYALEQEAAALRAPSVTYEERFDGRWRVTTPPSPAALARAAALEAQAKEHRRRSMEPMQKLAAGLPGTPFGKLADAELARMIGEYDRMLQAAEAALGIDPWHLEAHEYLVFHGPKVGRNDLAVAHQDVLDNLVAPSARVTIGPVPTLLGETRYTSALKLLDAGQAVEPACGRAAVLRGIVLAAAEKPAAAEPAFRVAGALEQARLAMLAGDSAPLPALETAPALTVQCAFAALLEGARAADAWTELHRLLRLAERISPADWDQELPGTDLPPVFTHQDDKRRTGMTVRELVVGAQLNGARLLAAQDRLEEAARLLIACKTTSEPMGRQPPIDAAAYPIIAKMGEARASRVFPPLMMEGYRVMARIGGVRETFRGTETTGKAGDRVQWVEARLKEIDQDLTLLARSQTMTAMKKRMELEQERQQLAAELQQLRRTNRRRP